MANTGTGSFFALMRELLKINDRGTARAVPAHLLTPGVDALVASSEWRLFAPLVALLLRGYAQDDLVLARKAGARLRGEAMRGIAVNMARQEVIRELGMRLSQAKIGVILLKASALTGWVYPAQAPRLGCDIDLLVRREDKNKLTAALAGYAEERDKFPTKPQLASLAYEWSFWTREPLVTELDVHHALCYQALYPIDYPTFWARSRPHPAYRVEELRVPSPEDMLLHLALHAFHDLRNWSRQDIDAALLMREETIDWDILVEHARSWGASAAAYFLLERIALDLSVSVPDRALNALRPGPVRKRIGHWALRSGASPDAGAGHIPRRFRQLVSQLAMSRSTWLAAQFQLDYLRARLMDCFLGIRIRW